MKQTDWLSGSRSKKVEMAKNWIQIFSAKAVEWNIPESATSRLNELTVKVEGELAIPENERSVVNTARINEALGALTAFMRDVKKRYFFQPPLKDSDILSLGLRPKDNEPTPVLDPTGQATADIAYPGRTQLLLNIKHVEGTPLDPRATYGYRIYWGLYADGDAPPADGETLIQSKFTRKKKELFTFRPSDSKKTAYFCIRYENSKGAAGPWGPMVAAVIP